MTDAAISGTICLVFFFLFFSPFVWLDDDDFFASLREAVADDAPLGPSDGESDGDGDGRFKGLFKK